MHKNLRTPITGVFGGREVDLDFNNKCHLCRSTLIEIDEADELMDDNRRRWRSVATALRNHVLGWMTDLGRVHIADPSSAFDSDTTTTAPRDSLDKVIQSVEANGGFEELLQLLDELAMLRWYVFRQFEPNYLKDYDKALFSTWLMRTKSGRHLRPADPAGLAVKALLAANKEINYAVALAISKQRKHNAWVIDGPSEIERIQIQKYTNPNMMPSEIFNKIVLAYELSGLFPKKLMPRFRLFALDAATWTIRQGDYSEDFPDMRAYMEELARRAEISEQMAAGSE